MDYVSDIITHLTEFPLLQHWLFPTNMSEKRKPIPPGATKV
jgi:hypothetical protein